MPNRRPALRLALPLLLTACGDSNSDTSFGDSNSQPTAASATTGDLGSSSGAPLPTTGADAPTTAADTTGPVDPPGDTTTSTTTATTTLDPDTTAASTSTTADDTTSTSSTTADDTTSSSSSTTADDTTSTGDDTNGCPAGSEGCPCAPNDACDAGLQCQAGVCVDVPVCGDGVVEGDEACDLGGMNSNTGACKLDCSAQACGDGFVGPGEACDLGGANSNTGACKLDCSKQACGDGFVGPGEACDDGNLVNGDGCEATCVKTPNAVDNCGEPQDGPWIEIDYGNANSPTNPTFKYSPGFGEPQWAPQDKAWPYIHAIGGVTLHTDNGVIGKVALLDGTNKYIRVFIGLGEIQSYDYATACVEGRSYSVGASVQFRVENALNDCGGNAMMANDWFDLHPTTVDIGPNCFIPGNDFQAIEVRPVGGSGSLSLRRMRFTLHGAVY